MYIRKNDTVLITRGKYKGRRGRVLESYPKTDRVLVEGVNIIKRHTRASRRNQQGGIVVRDEPIHISNVKTFNEQTGNPSRIKMKRLDDGRRIRIWAENGEAVD